MVKYCLVSILGHLDFNTTQQCKTVRQNFAKLSSGNASSTSTIINRLFVVTENVLKRTKDVTYTYERHLVNDTNLRFI